MNDVIMIKNIPENERPRERLQKYGVTALSNAELIAIAIGTGTIEENVITLAQRLMTESNYNNIQNTEINFLYDTTIEELMRVKGIGIAKACSILAAVELGKRVVSSKKKLAISITSPKAMADYYMDRLRFENKEQVILVMFNTKSVIMDDMLISVGGINSSILHPREVFSIAVRKSVASIALVHNHPSGDPTPSQQDIDITQKIYQAGNILDIPLVDHIIIGDLKYISMKEQGLLNK